MRCAKRAARAAITACAALLFIACDAPERSAVREPAPALIIHQDPAAPEFGAVDVVGIDRAVLHALEQALPSPDRWQEILSVYTGTAAPSDTGALFARRFTAGPADRASPRPEDWQIDAPPAGTRDPVYMRFPEPLDHALLELLLDVRRADGRAVAGHVEVGDGETRWSFTPDSPWAPGDYAIEVDTDLEDRAGNNLRHPFDVDRTAPPPAGAPSAHVRLPFTTVGSGLSS